MIVNTSEQTVGFYLKDISRHSPLSSADEIKLSEKIKAGDTKAKRKLIESNLRFVVNVALNYRFQGMPLADLIAEGNKGLIKAAERFDGSKNFKFISYAVWWVRQAILQALAEQSRISKIPLNKVADIYNLRKIMERLESRKRRQPSLEEVALEANLALEDVTKIMAISAPQISMDYKKSEESFSLSEILASDDRTDEAAEYEGQQKQVMGYIKVLNEREQKIIKLYFGLETDVSLTLEEIGSVMGLTRERVRQLKERAMEKLIFAHGRKGR